MKEKSSMFLKGFLLPLVMLIAVLGIGTSGFYYYKYQKAQDRLNNPVIAGQLEAQDLVKKVSRLMVLPSNEVPTVATVSDSNKLKEQQFFHNSQNGDKLLIFAKTKTAILYSVKLDKIINVGPLNIGQETKQVVGASTQVVPTRVATPSPSK